MKLVQRPVDCELRCQVLPTRYFLEINYILFFCLAVRGVFSDGLIMIGAPAAIAGPTLCITIFKG